MDWLDQLWTTVVQTSVVEWLAVLTGVLYVVLAAKQLLICWLFAFLSSAFYVYLCFTSDLYLESVLQVFYVVMAIVGWLSWKETQHVQVKSSGGVLDDPGTPQMKITTWKIGYHVLNIVGSGLVALCLGWFFDLYTAQANPYTDAFTTVFSLVATFMVTRKVLENWIYWIVIDLVSISLYASREFYLSSVLYAVFTFLAVFGFAAWYRQLKQQNQ